MKATTIAKDLIKHHEGLRLKAYLCDGNKMTIGWGHTGASTGIPIPEGLEISYERACTLFDLDFAMAEDGANKLLAPGMLKGVVTQARFDAFVVFVFNFGESVIKERDWTIWHMLNNGASDDELAIMWGKYRMAKGQVLRGLCRRRWSEALIAVGLPWQVTDDDKERGYRVELDTDWATVKSWAEAERHKYPIAPKPKQVIVQTPVKPAEKSKTVDGIVQEEKGKELVKVGGVLGFPAILGFIQQLAATQTVTNVFLFVLLLCFGAVVFGWVRTGYGRARKGQGRAEATSAKV